MNTQNSPQDVIIIGAGVSGIGLACTLSRESPDKRYLVLEQRDDLGGTWDLFRYPGIRSDSDMFTFSYDFKPWTRPNLLADGPSIKQYVSEAASENGVTAHIRFGRKVIRADWSSELALWTLTVSDNKTGESERYQTRFVFFCTGYYRYEAGYRPHFPGEEKFAGQIVQPQHWPEDLDYSGKRVVIIGSGATAITLVPSMADKAGHVTMLQRSPGYILSVPAIDRVAEQVQRWLPERVAYRLTRSRNILLHRSLYQICKSRPQAMRRLLLAQVRHQLKGKVDMRHFTPNYMPWDQRLCVVPNGDLFKVLREGRASIVTDHIDTFTTDGIRLKSGELIQADLIVAATGLDVNLLGGMTIHVDGEAVNLGERMLYQSVLIEGVPNAGLLFGYINVSWTLRVNIVSSYICRLLRHMDKHHLKTVLPVDDALQAETGSFVGGLSAGYIQRASEHLPRQGRSGPWRAWHDYLRDLPALKFAPVAGKELVFDVAPPEYLRSLDTEITAQ